MLYIVSTPIGNIKDITLRAIETLQEVDLIAAEDTRRTKKLLTAYDIKTPLTSYHDHNKQKKGGLVLRHLKEGMRVALVTDAGTPGISDPGYRLVNLAKENDIEIQVIPGVTALITALSLSGLASDAFIFEGFMPVKTAARRNLLNSLKNERRTMIFYESPHRILKTLKDIQDELGDPVVIVARELTKKFEEIREGSASSLIGHFTKFKPKGEFVLMFNLRKS